MKSKRKMSVIACIAALCVAAFVGCGGNDNEPPANEYGDLCIEDVTVYIASTGATTFAEIEPVFTKPDKAEQIAYTYDTKELKIENNVVTPLKRADKTVNVRAKSEHFNTVFAVNVEYIRFTGSDASPEYNVGSFPVAARAQKCADSVIDDTTTLIIGDSFTDDYFIGDYMTDYAADKQVMNAGISSTTSYHWEAAYKDIIGAKKPKNIVFHIGTNNFYDSHDDVKDTEQSLKRLFMFVHATYPESKIYWFNITQRTDVAYAAQVTETNSYMANWCAKYDWITCVDTCSKVKASMLRDGVHPKTEHYSVFTTALVEAGCEIVAK